MSFLEQLGIKINTNIKIDVDPDLQARPETTPVGRTGHEFYKESKEVSTTSPKTIQTDTTSVVAAMINNNLISVLRLMLSLGVSFYWEDKNEELHELSGAGLDTDKSVIFSTMEDFDDNINYLTKKPTKISPLAIYGLVNSFGTESCDILVGSSQIEHGNYVISGPQLIKDGVTIFNSLINLNNKPKGFIVCSQDDERMTIVIDL